MDMVSFGQILILIVFVLLALLNFVLQRVRRRAQVETANDESLPRVDHRTQAAQALPPEPRKSRDLYEVRKSTVFTPLQSKPSVKRLILQSRREYGAGSF